MRPSEPGKIKLAETFLYFLNNFYCISFYISFLKSYIKNKHLDSESKVNMENCESI